ncbi:MAG TPA: apolipoprotein N-acyltransferase [Rhizomicrobium sp.]
MAFIGDLLRNLDGWKRFAAAIVAGALSALAFAPFNIFVLLLLGYAALMLLLEGIGPHAHRTAKFALTGWAFGFGQFLVGLYWIVNAFQVDAADHAWQIPFVLILLPGGLALFPAFACVAATGFWQNRLARTLALPATLALSEYLRGHVLTGFPWNLAAYGWGGVPEVLQSASIVGAYGLSLLTILFGISLAGFFTTARRAAVLPTLMVGLFALIWVAGAARLGTVVANVPNVRLRIVQPNIPEAEKFQPQFVARNWQRLLDLSRAQQGSEPTHIIWPESAPPFLLSREPAALDEIAVLTGNNHVLIAGAARVMRDNEGVHHYYNSVYFFGHGGALEGIYDKFHLVPFGEYLPMESFFHAIGIDKLVDSPGGFTPGPGPRSFSVTGVPLVGPLVCYEIIFPDEVVGSPRPKWLVNVTNDAWFGTFAGPHQHLLIARVRAIEEGLPIARAAGTGISAIIDPMGRITAELGMDRAGALDGTLPQALPPTFYALHGDVLFAGLIVLLAGLGGILARPAKER